MATLFRPDPEEDLDDLDAADAGGDVRLLPELPEFAVIVSDVSTGGWHMAAVIGDSANPSFYVRAVTVRWPFMIARPVPSNRSADKPVDLNALSPTGTTPLRKLVVNWGWSTVEGSVSQLRFYIKRTAPRLFRGSGATTVRLTLKELAWPRRRIVLAMKTNPVTWNPRSAGIPASPPAQST